MRVVLITILNALNISISQLYQLNSGIENDAEVNLRVSSNMIGDSNDETNLWHELLLTDTQVSKLCKTFTNGSLANYN